MAMVEEIRRGKDTRLVKQRDGSGMDEDVRKEGGKRVYVGCTVMMDVGHVKDARAVDIIKAVTERIGEGRILAVRHKRAKEYEITLEHEDDTVFNRWIDN